MSTLLLTNDFDKGVSPPRIKQGTLVLGGFDHFKPYLMAVDVYYGIP